VTYAAEEAEEAELGGVPSRPGVAVLLRQQQDEGHGQRQVVEAVHVGVVPLLQGAAFIDMYILIYLYINAGNRLDSVASL